MLGMAMACRAGGGGGNLSSWATFALVVSICVGTASSLQLDQTSYMRPSISSFAIAPTITTTGIRSNKATTSRISSIRGGSMDLLASYGGIATSAAVVGTANLLGFAFTVITGSHKATDLVGVGCFALSAVATLAKSGAVKGGRAAASTALIGGWAARLASFLFFRIWMTGEDTRLNKHFATIGGTVAFWTVSFLWGFVVLLPHSMASAAPTQAAMGLDGYFWSGTALVGFLVETFADMQKWSFKNTPAYNQQWCDKGLWRFSRHPNYAGELSFWWSIYALCAPTLALSGEPWRLALGALSPAFLSTIILCVSGVNLAEARNDEKYGQRNDYKEYKAKTPLLFPFL